MRIVHLNHSDLVGGAARAAYRLHAGLARRGIDSRMLVARRAGADPRVSAYVAGDDQRERSSLQRQRSAARHFHRHDATRPPGYELFSTDRGVSGEHLVRQMGDADLAHLHWVARFLDYHSFFRECRRRRRRLVWTFHDMNPMTGGCHYAAGCARWQSGCGRCPQLGATAEDDLSRRVWRRKRAVLDALPAGTIRVVTPSRWLAGEAAQSPLFARFPRRVIPYGIDTEIFAPRPRAAARAELGIAADARVVLFTADTLTVERKGFSLLTAALSGLREMPGLTLLALGAGAVENAAGSSLKLVGHTDDDHMMSRVYSAADVFAIPSREDNLPNTVLEAMACGVPVAGFRVGGIPDLVREGETGLLAAPGDVDGLRAAIARLIEDDARREAMACAARAAAVGNHSLSIQADALRALYAEILAEPA